MYVHTFVMKLNSKTKSTQMKKLFTLAALVVGLAAQAQTKSLPAGPSKWTVDPVHSSVKFSVSHKAVSEVDGTFKMFNGSLDAPTPDFNNSSIKFTVDVNSINTDNDMRDKHLKSDDFFNAEKYPSMTFSSTSFKKIKGTAYVLEGNLTIRDVTKKIKFAVTYGGWVKDPYGNIKAGFKATGKISRSAYGLKWSKMTEAGGAIVGDEVTMVISTELTEQK
jgi:polyisoprenoid-binding protein YceI